MIYIVLIFIILLIFFYIIQNYFYKKENFCYGNVFCNKQDMCIHQECIKCGLRAPCKKDSDCGPNNCIKGCCDNH
jgi:hypothetical protein